MGGERNGGLEPVRRDVPLLVPGARDSDRNFADEATGRLFDEVAPSVVHIYSSRHPSDFGPSRGTGSGYIADNNGRVITDAHVVNNSKELWVTTSDGKRYRGQIEKIDDIQDLAVVKLVGAKPGQYKPLESGSTLSLTYGQPIFAFGHPHGKELFVSPGRFLDRTNMLDVLARQSGPDVVRDMLRVEDYKNPDDFYDFRDNLASPVVSGRMRLEGGNSGGPIVDGNGKVIGIAREVEKEDHASSFYSPVEVGDILLRNPRTKFSFQYGYEPEPWAKNYTDMWKENIPGALAVTTIAGGTGYVGMRFANRLSPNALPLVAGAYFGHNLLNDYSSWKASTNSPDAVKHGLATLADATVVGGSIAALFPKARTVGLIAMGVGATARLASEFIPNNLVMNSTTRDDGSYRLPFSRSEFLEEIKADAARRAPKQTPYYNKPPSINDNDANRDNGSSRENGGYDNLYNSPYKSPYLNTPSGMPKGNGAPLFPR